MTDALTYAAMLALGEDALADTFPHGANATNNRWTPAEEGEEPSLTRDDLLRRRRGLQERVCLLPTDSTRPVLKPYVHSASHKGALGAVTHTSETDMGESQEPELERVDDETQKRLTEEAALRFSTAHVSESLANLLGERDALRSQLTAYNNLAREKGMDIRSDVKVIERRIQALDRKLGLERAA